MNDLQKGFIRGVETSSIYPTFEFAQEDEMYARIEDAVQNGTFDPVEAHGMFISWMSTRRSMGDTHVIQVSVDVAGAFRE